MGSAMDELLEGEVVGNGCESPHRGIVIFLHDNLRTVQAAQKEMAMIERQRSTEHVGTPGPIERRIVCLLKYVLLEVTAEVVSTPTKNYGTCRTLGWAEQAHRASLTPYN